MANFVSKLFEPGSTTAIPLPLVITMVVLLAVRIGVATYESIYPPKATSELKWEKLAKVDFSKEIEGQSILLDFSADWCSPCKVLEQTTFCNKEIVDTVEKANFKTIKIVDRKKEDGFNPEPIQNLQDRFEISSFPTLVVALSNGAQVTSKVGTPKPSDMREFIREALILSKYTMGKEYLLAGRYADGAKTFKNFLDDNDWKHWRCNYAALMGAQCEFLLGRKADGLELIKMAKEKIPSDDFPFPLYEYYLGDIDYNKLVKKAGDSKTDRGVMHENLGISSFAENDFKEANEHFTWILKNSPKNWFEYRIAEAFIARMGERIAQEDKAKALKEKTDQGKNVKPPAVSP